MNEGNYVLSGKKMWELTFVALEDPMWSLKGFQGEPNINYLI